MMQPIRLTADCSKHVERRRRRTQCMSMQYTSASAACVSYEWGVWADLLAIDRLAGNRHDTLHNVNGI